MTDPHQIKSQVVDITKVNSSFPRDLVVDANVLYWVFFPSFNQLQRAGGNTPKPNQLNDYQKFWAKASTNKTAFVSNPVVLGEFAKLAEHAVIETKWLQDPAKPKPPFAEAGAQFNPGICKFARYHYGQTGDLPDIRNDVKIALDSVRKNVGLLPRFSTSADEHDKAVGEWGQSCSDYFDSLLVASAKMQRKTNLLSDDMDIATFDGVTLYTANRRLIELARRGGKLKLLS